MLIKFKIIETTQSMSLDHSEVKPAFRNSRAIKKTFPSVLGGKKTSYFCKQHAKENISEKSF